ncbi:Hypothetical predicted protein [Paramuricea clavata]|uniref:Uncharacterized protein n=1 Tax=Paramuricea clavata TaxID=317549 RepID=A0A6S7FQ41_PARCT|nr:Hypothetical predicted protein [Paramuricea clavata]
MAEKNIGESVDNTQEKQDMLVEDKNQEETMSTASNRCQTLKNRKKSSKIRLTKDEL